MYESSNFKPDLPQLPSGSTGYIPLNLSPHVVGPTVVPPKITSRSGPLYERPGILSAVEDSYGETPNLPAPTAEAPPAAPVSEGAKLVVAAAAEPNPRDRITARIPGNPEPVSNPNIDDTSSIENPDQTGVPLPAGHLEVTRSADGAREILINRAHPHQERADALVEELADGVPLSWTPVKPYTPSGSKVYYRDPESKFFVKVGPGPRMGEARIAMIDSDQNRTAEDKALLKELTTGRYNPEPEMELAPEIRRLLETEEAQQIAVANGYAGIRFVEPYAAIVNLETDQKLVVYDMHDGYISSGASVTVASHELGKFFKKHHIEPRDLNREHLLISRGVGEQRHLGLIDTELFSRITPSEIPEANPGSEVPRPEVEPEPAFLQPEQNFFNQYPFRDVLIRATSYLEQHGVRGPDVRADLAHLINRVAQERAHQTPAAGGEQGVLSSPNYFLPEGSRAPYRTLAARSALKAALSGIIQALNHNPDWAEYVKSHLDSEAYRPDGRYIPPPEDEEQASEDEEQPHLPVTFSAWRNRRRK